MVVRAKFDDHDFVHLADRPAGKNSELYKRTTYLDSSSPGMDWREFGCF